ncbi:hypothetical protein NPIL_5861 [Nephila pilipes]|uniref:Uncharacterized protein n=1 Tax=Nephila pilipes TaxID=299642 RepID=A0A8X6QBR3_NEPPI|nr:hypothetical protein NPIL_5861 [Nephila pilipes]
MYALLKVVWVVNVSRLCCHWRKIPVIYYIPSFYHEFEIAHPLNCKCFSFVLPLVENSYQLNIISFIREIDMVCPFVSHSNQWPEKTLFSTSLFSIVQFKQSSS